jgi:hypothetical protein
MLNENRDCTLVTGSELISSIAKLLSDKLNGSGHFMLSLLYTATGVLVEINVKIKIVQTKCPVLFINTHTTAI